MLPCNILIKIIMIVVGAYMIIGKIREDGKINKYPELFYVKWVT